MEKQSPQAGNEREAETKMSNCPEKDRQISQVAVNNSIPIFSVTLENPGEVGCEISSWLTNSGIFDEAIENTLKGIKIQVNVYYCGLYVKMTSEGGKR
jgi:hypothetical protein